MPVLAGESPSTSVSTFQNLPYKGLKSLWGDGLTTIQGDSRAAYKEAPPRESLIGKIPIEFLVVRWRVVRPIIYIRGKAN